MTSPVTDNRVPPLGSLGPSPRRPLGGMPPGPKGGRIIHLTNENLKPQIHTHSLSNKHTYTNPNTALIPGLQLATLKYTNTDTHTPPYSCLNKKKQPKKHTHTHKENSVSLETHIREIMSGDLQTQNVGRLRYISKLSVVIYIIYNI